MSRTWCTLGVALALALALVGCGNGSPSGAGSPSSSASGKDVSDEVPIGGGRSVYTRCSGTGSPTILLEAGDEADATQWGSVQHELATHTRTCSYTRLGVGSSSPATGCRHLSDLRGVLEDLLEKLGEKGPFVLVGTSGGGYLMAGYAYAHPARTVGMVLVETPHAVVVSEISPALRALLKCDSPSNIERQAYVDVENEAWRNRHRIGDIPMTVISNDYRGHGEGVDEQNNVARQKGWLVLSPRARQVVVTSGHNVPGNEPDLVAAEILKVLTAARAG